MSRSSTRERTRARVEAGTMHLIEAATTPVALASAPVHEPDVLLLDDPLGVLDGFASSKQIEVLRELHHLDGLVRGECYAHAQPRHWFRGIGRRDYYTVAQYKRTAGTALTVQLACR